MELFDIYKNLIQETCLFRTYKRMSVLTGILCAIVVAPFILAYIVWLITYALVLIVHKILNAPHRLPPFLYQT